MRIICIAVFILGLGCASRAATLALWDFNDPSLGAASGAALPDSDGYTVWREAAADKSGNGNHLTTWDYAWAGFNWSSFSPAGDFSIKAAGNYPAAYTWSAESAPGGIDLEAATPAQFTIEGVFTVASGSANRTLVGRDGQNLSTVSPASAALYLQIDGNDHPAFEFTDINAKRVRLVAAATVADDASTWYHMAGVSDGSTVSIYLNHELVASTNLAMGAVVRGPAGGADWHAGGWSVARGLWNGNHSDRWFGQIDAVAISDAALDAGTFVLDVPVYTNPVPVEPFIGDVTDESVYLMCYHEGPYPSGGSSGVFISWSTNGYDFNALNYGHPVFVPPEFPGDDADNTDAWGNLTRDPSMTYGPDGRFHLVFTSDIFSRSFGYAESPDLIHWSNVKLVQIWENETHSIGRTWAPEIYYDTASNVYMVAFSSDVGSDSLHIHYTTTTDFNTWTEPQDLYRKPDDTTVIDGFVAQVAPENYVIAMARDGAIWLADGPTAYGPWTNNRQASAGGDEGPALIKIGDTWHLYYDNYGYTDDVFGMMISTDNAATWTDVSGLIDTPKMSDIPDYGYSPRPPHHCTVFEVPTSSLAAFMTPLQDNVTNFTALTYRWSFNEAAGSITDGTIVTDTVSGAEAAVVGNRAEFTGNGLRLPGDTTGTGDAAYLDLPNGIISRFTNLTVEVWATPIASATWQRLFSFGRTAETGDGGGEWNGPASGGTSADDVLFWSLNSGSDINLQVLKMQHGGGAVSQSPTGMETAAGTRYHYVFTFEEGVGFFGAAGGRMTFYREGYQIGWRDVSFRLRDIEDVNNWLGRSQWSGDSNSNVEYDEVRIYAEALSGYDIYGHYLAGPDVPVDDHPGLALDLSGGSSTLTWSGNVVGLSLESTDALGPSNTWSKIPDAVVNSTNGLQVTQPLSNDSAFYRLGE